MKLRQLLPTLGLILLPALAQAHPGHDESGLLAGLLHPLNGADHLLAMLAIGIWAALQKRTLQLAVPATFLLALLAGFMLGVQKIQLPLVESGIALSVLLLGLLIAGAARLPAAVALLLTGCFALFHGYAHGAEARGDLLAFAGGFFLTSLGLHLAGGLATLAIRQRLPLLARASGAAIATSGALMLF